MLQCYVCTSPFAILRNFLLQNSILIYGGLKLNDYSITNEFWKFDVTSQSWSEISSPRSLPPTLFGHTAHLVQMGGGKEFMIVIFGFHPEWRYSSFVFQIDVSNLGRSHSPSSTYGAIAYFENSHHNFNIQPWFPRYSERMWIYSQYLLNRDVMLQSSTNDSTILSA